ncbi:MAG: PqqD family protein [Deltaproteobacteria bacterium]|nr:PqqD family protein [Deltaproteobacteria bacterium]
MASREIDGEFYVLTADSTFHSVTDAVGAFVLERVETSGGGITVRRLISAVEEEFDAEGRDVPTDILAFVADLVDKGVLETVR